MPIDGENYILDWSGADMVEHFSHNNRLSELNLEDGDSQKQ